jgi:hypothetical protein
MTDPPASSTPLYPLHPPPPCTLLLAPLSSLANALDNIRGVTRRLTSVTVTGIVRPQLSSSYLHLLNFFFSFFQVNETAVIRYNYGDPTLGTCKESVQGGNHFRYWIQSGGSANRYYFCLSSTSLDNAHLLFFFSESGAVFMAVSYELSEQCESRF